MPPPDDGSTRYAGPPDETRDNAPPADRAPPESAEPLSPQFDIGEARLLADLRLLPSPRPDALGRLGHYDVLSFVGSGAMGVVLKAFDNELHRAVAIKVLSSHLITSEAARERFVREARAAATVNHPNVVTIHAIDHHNRIPYIVMEYVDGSSLQQRIERGTPMFTIDILRISSQIAGGLAAAHARGVIHRDIKPANIMLEDHVERVKITDFGLAKAAQANSDLTSFGKMVGTPAFMSPEQVRGDPLHGRSDLFSVGCVMYAMVAGHSPFRGGNCLAVAHNIASESHRPLREAFPDTPRFLEEVVERLLEKDPAQRYQSADELAEELTRRLARVNQWDSGVIPSDSVTTKIVIQPPPTRRSRVFSWLAGAALVALVAGWIWWGPRPEDPDQVTSPNRLTGVSPNGSPAPDSDALLEQPFPGAGTTLLVGQQPQAAYRTIQEALDAARPGNVIQIIDDRTYAEEVRFDSPRHRGVMLQAIAGAGLEAPDGVPLVTVAGVVGVRLAGLRCRLQPAQFALELEGDCAGLLAEDLRFEAPAASSRAVVYLHRGAHGTAAHPIVLRQMQLRCGGVGIVLEGSSEQPVDHVRIEENVVTGPLVGEGVLVVIDGAVRNVVITRNLVTNGQSGVVLVHKEHCPTEGIVAARNTFQNLKYLLTLEHAPLDRQRIDFEGNLILDTAGVQWGTQPIEQIPQDWFRDNVWEDHANCHRKSAQIVARLAADVPLLSRDPAHADFLKPAADALPELAADDSFPGRFERPAAAARAP